MPPIPSHSTATSTASWDGPANKARLPNERDALRAAFAWVDPDGGPTAKASYKFIHHEVAEGGDVKAANVRGCQTGINVLNGARQGTTIPDADRKGVYNHLARHLRDADVEPAPLKGADAETLDVEPWASHAWALRPEVLGVVAKVLSSDVTLSAAVKPEAARRPAATMSGGIAVIPLRGMITPQPSLLSLLFGGGGGLAGFRESFREAVRSDEVGGIVLDVDSPGGTTELITEMATEIREARGKKPIVAVANTEAGSAAYWIASQADELVVTPSGSVGGIGVFAMHVDESAANAMQGFAVTLISAGRFKTENNPFEPLTDEAKAEIQRLVDEFYGLFTSDVAAGREVSVDTVQSGFGEGRMVTAQRAVELGMADRVESFDGVLARLAGKREPAPRVQASAESRALRLARPRRV